MSQIGEPRRIIEIEPVEQPVEAPVEQPAEPVEDPA